MNASERRCRTLPFHFLLLLLFVLPGCTKRQVEVTAIDSREPDVSAGAEVEDTVLANVEQPDYFAEQGKKAAEALDRDARRLVDAGRVRVFRGQLGDAQVYFDEALDLLDESGFPFDEYPFLESTYGELEAEIRRIEVLAAAEPDDTPLRLSEELAESLSPLDDIAGLDLYAVEVDPKLENLVSEDLKQTPFDFPIVVNEQVLRFLDYYQGRGRKATEEALRRSGRYVDEFRKIFAEEGLPQDLVYMAHVESLFKPKAYSRARARGIWQFMSGTGRVYGLNINWWVDERMDFERATRSAARMLKDLKEEFGDWYLVLAAYNVGKGRVGRALRRYGDMDYWTMVKRRLIPRETRNFVPSILAAMIIYKNPARYGFDVQPDPPMDREKVAVPYQADLNVIADLIDVDVDLLDEMNPELLRGITPFESDDYYLKVPPGKAIEAAQQLADLPPDKRLRWAHHKVRNGETLSLIASRYRVAIRAIADMNRIRNVNRLSLGQDLIIPLSDYRAVASAGSGMPSSGSHIVRRGDSLYRIARHYGVRMNDLFKWNNLGPRDTIHPGQEIRLSGD